MTYNNGTRINLRAHKEEDFPSYFRALNDPGVQEGQGTFTPVSEKFCKKIFPGRSEP